MPTSCLECLSSAEELLQTSAGSAVCAACAAAHYVECGDCRALTPRDESREADGVAYCVSCYERAFAPGAKGVPDPVEVQALVAEYVRLEEEAKKLDERLGEIKERLKLAALASERVAGSVTLGSGDAIVKCGFSTSFKVDSERAAELEAVFGPDRFAQFFERKVTIGGVKSSLERLLAGTLETDEVTREAVLGVVDVVETPRLTVARPRKSTKKGAETV